MEIKDEPTETAVNSGRWLKDTFMVIPWSILSINKEFIFPEKMKMTLNDKWMATFLAYLAAKSEDCICRPTNKEIDRAMGTPLHKPMGVNPHRRVTDRLSKLEGCRLIAVSGRKGRGREIIVCQALIDMVNDVGKPEIMALTISPEVFQLHLSIPKKIVLAAKLRLKAIGADTLSKRLEISKSQVYQHLKGIEKIIIQLSRKPESNLSETRNQLSRKPDVGIVGDSLLGIDNNIVSKDTIIPPAVGREENLDFPPIGEASSKPLETISKNLPQEELPRYPIGTPVPAAATLSKWDDPKVEAALAREHRRGQPTPTEAKPSIEVENLTKYKNITHHKDPNNKAYRGAFKTIRSLEKGPGVAMDDAQRRRFIQVNQNSKINIAQIEGFLTHQFTKEERERLYKRLDDSRSPAYCAEKKKSVSLAAAMENPLTGYSKLLHLWNHPPKLIQITVREELQEPVEIIKKAFPDSTGGISTIADQFLTYYRVLIKPRLDKEQATGWKMISCLKNLIAFSIERNSKYPIEGSSVGWIRPGSETFQSWENNFWLIVKEEVGRKIHSKYLEELYKEEEPQRQAEYEEMCREASEDSYFE